MSIEETLISIHNEIKKIFELLDGNRNSVLARTQQEIDCPKLIPARKWSKYQKFPTQGSINRLLLERKDNGFDKCTVRISGRLYIDRDLYLEWVENQKESKNNPDYIKEHLNEKNKNRSIRRA